MFKLVTIHKLIISMQPQDSGNIFLKDENQPEVSSGLLTLALQLLDPYILCIMALPAASIPECQDQILRTNFALLHFCP